MAGIALARLGVRARLLDRHRFPRDKPCGDGVHSVVARATGLGDGVGDDRLAIDTMEETPRDELWMKDPESLYVAYGYQGYAGYGYVFPKKHHVDAGVGFLVSFYKRKIDA